MKIPSGTPSPIVFKGAGYTNLFKKNNLAVKGQEAQEKEINYIRGKYVKNT